MTYSGKSVCSVLAILALSACGGGGGGGGGIVIGAEEEAARVFSEGNGDVADILAGGGKLTARKVSEVTWREDFPDGGSYTPVDGVFSLEGSGNDLIVTMGAEDDPRTFVIVGAASLDADNVRFEDEETGEVLDIFISGNTFADLFDDTTGSGYAIRVGYFYTSGTETFGYQGDAVIGTETTDAGLDLLATSMSTLEYSGFGRMNIRQADAGFVTFNARLGGDVLLTADFDSGTVSGEMNNLFYEERRNRDGEGVWEFDEFTEPDGTITMNETTFTTNGFQGTLSPDATLAGGDPGIASLSGAVTYSGAFYGDTANEVGGTFEGAATIESQDYVAQGHWSAGEILP